MDICRVGSISKTMTAIGVMQLWEQGKFNLDDPVNDHLKSFILKTKVKASPPITIKHLLTHTSGANRNMIINKIRSDSISRYLMNGRNN